MPEPTPRPPPLPDLTPRMPVAVSKASHFLGRFRWLFMPMGLLALLAVGVHAAADTVDDRILWFVDRLDAWLDSVFSLWTTTQPWVDWIQLGERTALARGVTLVWELAADLVLAVQLWGYVERSPTTSDAQLAVKARAWKAMWLRLWTRPTALRVIRPSVTALLAAAGACSVAKMVQGASYLSSREWLGDAFAGPMARVLAVSALVAVLGSLGWRAVARTLEWADEMSLKKVHNPLEAMLRGTVGAVVVVPLGVAAAFDAIPLLSFFR